MSTFNGLVAEFPDIRVDYFRAHPDLRPPLACFLSHIHSDHLAGLESLRSPFVYCSAATRAMLLRLEKYASRVNYAAFILETRIQRFRHLKNLLKPIPLDTPTVLELEPGNHLQVTLLDANHCPGAVMFLFEGQGKAALYTGDIRSEPWWVSAISRSPSLIAYAMGLKILDTIYLDTSFIDPLSFPTKAEGTAELLQKVLQYPPDTVFHFQAWTYGYENVWLALSKALGSKIHVDEYKMLMFRSLVVADSESKSAPSLHLATEAPGLVGFVCGNAYHSGCLTRDENVRLHSCEKGMYCDTIKNSPVVWIRPVITRLPDGQDVAELGVGGGGDDLERKPELDYLSLQDVDMLLQALSEMEGISADVRQQVGQFLLSAIASGRRVPLDLDLSGAGETTETDLGAGLQAITSRFQLRDNHPPDPVDRQGLPSTITFPYSRHSSYPELCHFLSVFKPKDVWPCTVDVPRWVHDGITIERLFGQHCSGHEFRHDSLMRDRFESYGNEAINNIDSQASDFSQVDRGHAPAHGSELPAPGGDGQQFHAIPEPNSHGQAHGKEVRVCGSSALDSELHNLEEHASFEIDPTSLQDSPASSISEPALEARMYAFQAVLEKARGRVGEEIGLLSTTDNHSRLEQELDCVPPQQ